jgi:TPR repeat protein
MTRHAEDEAALGYFAWEQGEYEASRAAYERGAAKGCTSCMHGLALIYDNGEGVPVDKAAAMRWYRKAWRTDKNPSAGNNIAILYREAGNSRAMFQWFRRTAEAGEDGDAYLEMAKCYLDGVGVRKSQQLAVRCLALVDASPYVMEASIEEAQALLRILGPRLA